jgi:hypothetical protein
MLREMKLVGWGQWAITVWSWWYTADLTFRATDVTSSQWVYLMSVPGGHWTWAALFGWAAINLTTGMLMRRYWLRAVALALMGFGCFFTSAFYVAAPLIEPGLLTLGYHGWFLSCGLLLFLAVVNWRPVRCF